MSRQEQRFCEVYFNIFAKQTIQGNNNGVSLALVKTCLPILYVTSPGSGCLVPSKQKH